MFWNYVFSDQKPLKISHLSQNLCGLLMGLEKMEASGPERWSEAGKEELVIVPPADCSETLATTARLWEDVFFF